MNRCSKILAAIILLFGLITESSAGSLNGVIYSLPSGWVEGEQDGIWIAAPSDATEENVAVVVIHEARSLGEATFNDWFTGMMRQNLAAEASVVSEGDISSQSWEGTQLLTTARAVQDTEGGLRIQMFHAVSNGRMAASAMAVAASEASLDKYAPAIQSLFSSLRLTEADPDKPAAPGQASSGKPSTPDGPSSRASGEAVPLAGVVGGRPQGLFVGVSLLSGKPVFLLFLDGGRVFHNMPKGGLNQINWTELESGNPDICGRWSQDGSNLRIQWNDGNVWEGPLELTQTGIQFQGKRYGKAFPVKLEDMVGGWESTASTAWLAPGSGDVTTQVNELRVDADGGFSFGSSTGSNVAGASAYGESSFSGHLTVQGYDALFQGSDGQTRRMSVVRLDEAGSLILDGSFFTSR